MDQFDIPEEDLPEFYCQICDKSYKNQKALENHQTSKQHKKNMKLLLEQVASQEEIEEIKQKEQEDNEPSLEEHDEEILPEISEKPEIKSKNKKKNKKNK